MTSKNVIFIIRFQYMTKQSITSDFYYNRTMDPVIYNQFKEGGQYHWSRIILS